jgi:transketolase
MDSMFKLAREDKNIFLITADLGFGVFEEFASEFPKQFANVGVAEQNMMGIATGLAMEGRKVFTYSIGNFATLRCLEQVRNDACYHEANVNIVASGGGVAYGAYGYSHHATEDLAILRALPGVTVVAPSDKWEAGEATKALAKTPGVGYLRIEKAGFQLGHEEGEIFTVGKARRVREGKDITFISLGGIMSEVIASAESLKALGFSCRVISMHTVKPIDRAEIIAAAQQTGGILVVEEHNIVGGLGGAVAEVLMQEGVMPKFFKQMGFNDQYCAMVGDQDYLRSHYGIDELAIAAVAKILLDNK